MLCFSLPEGEIAEWAIYMMGAYGIRPIFAWRGSLQISLRIENATFKNNAFWYKIELKIANLLIMAAYPHIKEWFPDVLTKYGKHCGMIIKRFSLIVTLYYFANDCFLILEAKVKFCEMDCNGELYQGHNLCRLNIQRVVRNSWHWTVLHPLNWAHTQWCSKNSEVVSRISLLNIRKYSCVSVGVM